MKKLFIEPGCISCGSCAFIAPEVFEVTDISRIKPDVPLENYSERIKCAAAKCPVNVIKYQE
jgi:ferredoxin